ncbi:MAG: MauE/DoxX family redox-associated membrane protein [Microthrixaceae bacterium]
MSIVWVLTALGAGLLVVAGIPKLTGAAKVPMLPELLARPLGLAEVLVGGWVLVDPSTPALVAMAGTYLLLAAALVVAMARSEPDCGCFGVDPVKPSSTHLVLNVAFCAVACVALLLDGGPEVPMEDVTLRIVVAVLAVTGAAMLAELMSTVSDIGDTRAALRRTQ